MRKLSFVNKMAKNPSEFIELGENDFNKKSLQVTEMIADNIKNSSIVLLSGPSASGKSTSTLKIRENLLRKGINAHVISTDNYFADWSTYPRQKNGEIDLESPKCLDLDLMLEHFAQLQNGNIIEVPHFDFETHRRTSKPDEILRLQKDEIAIYEGLHVLNDDIAGKYPEAFKIYLSARSNIFDENQNIVFKGTWIRLTRRCMRDKTFRGTDIKTTLNMWDNVRQGEKLYVSPYKSRADYIFDSSLVYEVNVFCNYANELFKELFKELPNKNIRKKDFQNMLKAYQDFTPMSSDLVPKDSVLREFIGGGKFDVH